MRTARRAAAWVAWAVWTCKIARLQATPAIAGYSLKESGLRPALFFGAPAGRARKVTRVLGCSIVIPLWRGSDSAARSEEQTMRYAVAMLACFGLGPIVFADTPTPTPPPAPSEAAPASAAAEAPSAAAAAPTASASGESPKPAATTDHREQLLQAKGYRLETRNGEKVYCKTEQVLGSRIAGKTVCGTVNEWQSREQLSKDMAQSAQQHQLTPTGN